MREVASLRVLVVHDHQAFAEAMCLALGDLPVVAWCRAVHDIAGAYEFIADEAVNVAVLGALPNEQAAIGGAAELRSRCPDARIILITAASNLDALAEAALVGVDAFLPSTASLEELSQAVVTEEPSDLGHSELLAVAAEAIRQCVARRRAAPVIELTEREREVLGLLAQGVATKDIARLLGIQLETCRGYVKTLLAKLGARSQLQGVVFAAREGLLDGETLDGVG